MNIISPFFQIIFQFLFLPAFAVALIIAITKKMIAIFVPIMVESLEQFFGPFRKVYNL